MLVLSRKRNEQIVIRAGDRKIVVTIVRIDHGNKVRIGVEAPVDVSILRRELLSEDFDTDCRD